MKRLMHDKEIFSIFRQHNVVEYKNPNDSLNARVISKIIGYANFYIGLARKDGERPRSEVSISIFREGKNTDLFDAMLADGTLKKTATPGIYHVKNLTDLPFQIVITGDLEGEKYAAYRILSDHADEKDVELVMERRKNANNADSAENMQKLIEFAEEKNPGIIRRIIGGDEDMASILMDVLKPEIDEKIGAAIAENRKTTTLINLFTYVQDGVMPIDYAAKQVNLSTADFTDSMRKAGYKVPQGTLV